MTAAIAIIVLLALIVGASKLLQHWLDSYLKDDDLFDEEMSRQECEALLKAASKAPKRRVF